MRQPRKTTTRWSSLVAPSTPIRSDLMQRPLNSSEILLQKKPIAAICHGAWILTDADALRGKTVTSYPSVRTDLVNAGATWVDREVVVDENLITSRTPQDLAAFNEQIVAQMA